MDDLFGRLRRRPFDAIMPNQVPHEGVIGGAQIGPTGWYAAHGYSSSIAQANSLYDPTFETLTRTDANATLGGASCGLQWKAKYVLNSGTAPGTKSFGIGEYRATTGKGSFRSTLANARLGGAGDAASDTDLYVYPTTAWSPRGEFLDWMVAHVRVLIDAVPSGFDTATVTLEIYNTTDSSVVASSEALDLTTATTKKAYQLVAAVTETSSVFNSKSYDWRLKISGVWSSALPGNGISLFIAEPSIHFNYTPEPLPYEPAIGYWRPPEMPQLLGSNESLAAGTQIVPPDWALLCVISSSGIITLTQTPTINHGRDGQEMILMNIGSNAITLQDRGTLASSGLYLTTATIALGQYDSLRLVYSSDVGGWVQTAPVTNVL